MTQPNDPQSTVHTDSAFRRPPANATPEQPERPVLLALRRLLLLLIERLIAYLTASHLPPKT